MDVHCFRWWPVACSAPDHAPVLIYCHLANLSEKQIPKFPLREYIWKVDCKIEAVVLRVHCLKRGIRARWKLSSVVVCHILFSVIRRPLSVTNRHELNQHWTLQWRLMDIMALQITGNPTVCSTVSSGAHQRKYPCLALLAFVREIHQWPVVPLAKGRNAENVSIWWRHHHSGHGKAIACL